MITISIPEGTTLEGAYNLLSCEPLKKIIQGGLIFAASAILEEAKNQGEKISIDYNRLITLAQQATAETASLSRIGQAVLSAGITRGVFKSSEIHLGSDGGWIIPEDLDFKVIKLIEILINDLKLISQIKL